jgi:hypothetical protein
LPKTQRFKEKPVLQAMLLVAQPGMLAKLQEELLANWVRQEPANWVTLEGKSVAETKKYGPYKGSKDNGGRPIYVIKKKGKDGKWHTTSETKARHDYEKKTGKKVPKGTDVDHKNNNHSDDRSSNLQLLKHGKNTAKENKRRAGKKS